MIFKHTPYLIRCIVLVSIICCKVPKNALTKVENFWNPLLNELSDGYEKRNVLGDTLCGNTSFINRKTIKIWGKSYQSDSFLVIEHMDYVAKGNISKGLPNGEWHYINKQNCVYFTEVFKCGFSHTRYSYTIKLSNKAFDCQDKKVANFDKEIYKLVRFRNKLHKKIYEEQKSMW